MDLPPAYILDLPPPYTERAIETKPILTSLCIHAPTGCSPSHPGHMTVSEKPLSQANDLFNLTSTTVYKELIYYLYHRVQEKKLIPNYKPGRDKLFGHAKLEVTGEGEMVALDEGNWKVARSMLMDKDGNKLVFVIAIVEDGLWVETGGCRCCRCKPVRGKPVVQSTTATVKVKVPPAEKESVCVMM